MEYEINRKELRIEGRLVSAEDVKLAVRDGLSVFPEHMADLYEFLYEWFDNSDSVTVQTSGSTGVPKRIRVEKKRMIASAVMTCSFLGLDESDNALLCMNLKYIGAKMMVVRSIVSGMNLVVRPATGHPFSGLTVPVSFAALVPMQMYNTMLVPKEAEMAARVGTIIIGGGTISSELLSLVAGLPSAVYSTYGMTETLSHIALRRLNGTGASDCYYPLPGVNIKMSDERTLVVDAPSLCSEMLKTNDIAEILSDGGFRILGRLDNVINTGGVKVSPEEVEKMLEHIIDRPYVITSLPDGKFGESVVLMVEGICPLGDDIKDRIRNCLPEYYFPKHILLVDRIPMTENGKIARSECRCLAEMTAAQNTSLNS